jgi:hypothetical protein
MSDPMPCQRGQAAWQGRPGAAARFPDSVIGWGGVFLGFAFEKPDCQAVLIFCSFLNAFGEDVNEADRDRIRAVPPKNGLYVLTSGDKGWYLCEAKKRGFLQPGE